MAFNYRKVKSASKEVKTRGPLLEKVILETMRTISDIVGGTLGPGGQPVLIERQEQDLSPIVTKDGVTVFRNLGFRDATAQVILESARDAAVRTATEAGDGTTTCTILSEAIVRLTYKFCKENPRMSPQRVVRKLMDIFQSHIEPTIRSLSTKAELADPDGKKMLHAVAKVSANGDIALADAVLNCFDLVGDGGNVTLTEFSGHTGYEVERIEGYPLPGVGFEDSCGKYQAKFINDPQHQRVFFEKPVFVVYHGQIRDIQSTVNLMEKVAHAWEHDGFSHNVVLVATGFSETVTAQLAFNFAQGGTINVVPMTIPPSPVAGGQLGVLEDICAFTGAKLLDQLSSPLETATIEDLGSFAKSFEMTRFRSTIFSKDGALSEDGVSQDPPNMFLVLEQVSRLDNLKLDAASDLDKSFFEERIGKLTGGIARLKIIGSSSGEMRERRDRAEDAVCAVRGAIQHGVLPGGGWTLLRLIKQLSTNEDPVISKVLCPALMSPVVRLLSNIGFQDSERNDIIKNIISNDSTDTFDAQESKFVNPFENGLLDSTPAVLEALRSSLSIASLLGTLGGAVVFPRDSVLEQQESTDTRNWMNDANEEIEREY
jgi:chaperonin GroEL